LLAEKVDCLGAAASHFAVGDDLAIGIELVEALGQIVERDEMTAEVGDLVFVGLAHVEDEKLFAGVETAFQFSSGVVWMIWRWRLV
jgi:hypothetical protein